MIINAKVGIGVKNTYELTLIKPDGSKKKYVSHNMVLDNYFTYLITNNAAPNLSVIRVGQGTTAPALTDVALGSLRGSYSATVTNTTTSIPTNRVLSYTLAEGVLTGNISEIGLSNSTSGTVVYTKSLVQDAEGNPIVVVKDALDILTIRVTVYYSWQFVTTPAYVTAVNPLTMCQRVQAGSTLLTSNNYYGAILLPEATLQSAEGVADTICPKSNSGSISVSTANSTIKATSSTLLAANYAWQNPEWIMRTIMVSGFVIDVEASGLFTPYQHNNLAIGTGDGTTTEFDIPLMHYDASSAEIYVDNVLQSSGVTVINKNLAKSMHTLPSADPTKIYEVNGASNLFRGALPVLGPFKWIEADYASDRDIKYDFGSNISVTHVFHKNRPPQYYHNNATYPDCLFTLVVSRIRLYSSSDGETWNLATDITGISPSATYTAVAIGSTITARYFRLILTMTYTNNGGFSGTKSGFTCDCIAGFGTNTKSITFDTAPANGAVITAKCQTPIPYKSLDFQLSTAVQIKVERAT